MLPHLLTLTRAAVPGLTLIHPDCHLLGKKETSQNCQFVPGMSQYGESQVSQEFSQVEVAIGNAVNLSFSTGSANSPGDFREADQESAAIT